MLVVWDDDALSDLEAIGDYIAQDNPFAARRVVQRIRDVSVLLEMSPYLGRPARAREGVRELTMRRYPYIIVYEIERDQLRILGVVHHAQNRP